MGLSASQRATRNGLRTAFTSDRATVTRPRNLEVFQSWSNKYSYLPDHISLLYAQAHASAVDLSLCLSACGKSPCIPTTTPQPPTPPQPQYCSSSSSSWSKLAAFLGCRLGPRIHASTYHATYPIVSGAASPSSSFLSLAPPADGRSLPLLLDKSAYGLRGASHLRQKAVHRWPDILLHPLMHSTACR